MRAVAEGRAERQSRPTTSRDYEAASRNFDEIHAHNAEAAEILISQTAREYALKERLGKERRELLSRVMQEKTLELTDRVRVLRSMLVDRAREQNLSRSQLYEETLAIVDRLGTEFRQMIINDPRVQEAFVQDQDLLELMYGEQTFKTNIKMYARIFGVPL